MLSHVRLFVALQALLSMGFPRHEYWSGLPFPPLKDLLNLGIEPTSPASPALAGGFFTANPPGKPSLILVSTFFRFHTQVMSLGIYHSVFGLFSLSVMSFTCIHVVARSNISFLFKAE